MGEAGGGIETQARTDEPGKRAQPDVRRSGVAELRRWGVLKSVGGFLVVFRFQAPDGGQRSAVLSSLG